MPTLSLHQALVRAVKMALESFSLSMVLMFLPFIALLVPLTSSNRTFALSDYYAYLIKLLVNLYCFSLKGPASKLIEEVVLW